MSAKGGKRTWLDGITEASLNGSMRSFVAVMSVPLIFGAGCSAERPQERQDRFAGRDGRAEALADQNAGRPIRLYGYKVNGLVPGMPATVAILNCQATDYLPELFYSEGYARSESEQRLVDSAFQFAADYNLATFGNRRAELLERCPEAALLEGQS